MGIPKSLDGFFSGQSHLEMDENWGYPYFRKYPYIYITIHTFISLSWDDPSESSLLQDGVPQLCERCLINPMNTYEYYRYIYRKHS